MPIIIIAIPSARVPCAATITIMTTMEMRCIAIHVQMVIVIVLLVLGGASD